MKAIGSFVTEPIRCDKCLMAAREVLRGPGEFHQGAQIGFPYEGYPNLPIIAGQIMAHEVGEEIDMFEVVLAPLLAPRICHGHTLRVTVLGEGGGERIFHLDPLQGGGILADKPRWWKMVDEVHRQVAEGNDMKPYSLADGMFLMLALCGEVGQAANVLKKLCRGDFDMRDATGQPTADRFDALQAFGRAFDNELADVRIMLELVARFSNTNLDAAVEKKFPEAVKKLRKRGIIK